MGHQNMIEGQLNCWAINAIATHPVQGTFVTAGSDGQYKFWDIATKLNLKAHPSVGGPIPAIAYNRTGDVLAYAISYDWLKGDGLNTSYYPTRVMLHPTLPEESNAPKCNIPQR